MFKLSKALALAGVVTIAVVGAWFKFMYGTNEPGVALPKNPSELKALVGVVNLASKVSWVLALKESGTVSVPS